MKFQSGTSLKFFLLEIAQSSLRIRILRLILGQHICFLVSWSSGRSKTAFWRTPQSLGVVDAKIFCNNFLLRSRFYKIDRPTRPLARVFEAQLYCNFRTKNNLKNQALQTGELLTAKFFLICGTNNNLKKSHLQIQTYLLRFIVIQLLRRKLDSLEAYERFSS